MTKYRINLSKTIVLKDFYPKNVTRSFQPSEMPSWIDLATSEIFFEIDSPDEASGVFASEIDPSLSKFCWVISSVFLPSVIGAFAISSGFEVVSPLITF